MYMTNPLLLLHYIQKKYDISELVLKSILRQEKLENLVIDFTDDLIQKKEILSKK